jgi:hypothetical protein
MSLRSAAAYVPTKMDGVIGSLPKKSTKPLIFACDEPDFLSNRSNIRFC